MELCITTQSAISNLPSCNYDQRSLITTYPSQLRTKSAISLKQNPVLCSGYGLRPRILYYTNPLPGATTSEGTSSGSYQYVGDKQDGAVTVEDVPDIEKNATSEGTSSGPYQYVGDKRDGTVTVEDVPEVEKNAYNEIVPTETPKEESPVAVDEQTFELLEKLNIKFDSEDSYLILLYGSGALLALWLALAVVGAIDSIPLFPKLMEIVGLGYTCWFTYRYLLFKNNRDELLAKIEEVKDQVLE